MTPDTLVQYVRFLHDNFVANQALSALLSTNKKQPASATRTQSAPVARASNSATPATSASPVMTPTMFNQLLETLRQLMQPLYSASQEEQEVLSGFGVLEYSKESTYYVLQERVKTSPQTADAQWEDVSKDLTQFLTKLRQVYTSLNMFKFHSLVVPEGQADIEVTFDGAVAIDNVVDAKEQFSEWNLILEGYARALGCAKEDFAFVTVSKASPTKLRIRTRLEHIALILTIVTGILAIEQRFVEKRSAIEQIKTTDTPLVSREADEAYIKQAEEAQAKQVQDEVERLATESLQNIDVTDPETQAYFVTGVGNQYQFIVSGGAVNVYLPQSAEASHKQLLEEFHKEKAKLQQLEERLKIMQGRSTKEIPKTAGK